MWYFSKKIIFVCLKKTIAILFFVSYFLNSFHLIDVAKLPILFEHFQEHKKNYNTIGFVTFLKMHYSGQNTHDDTDAKLPFKSVCHCNITFIAVLTNTFFKVNNIEIYTDNLKQYYNQFHYNSNYLNAIWQPPRIS